MFVVYGGVTYNAGSVDDGIIYSDGLEGWFESPVPYFEKVTFTNPNLIAISDFTQQLGNYWPSPTPESDYPQLNGFDQSVSSSFWIFEDASATVVLVIAAAVNYTPQVTVVNAKKVVDVINATILYTPQTVVTNAKKAVAVIAGTVIYAGQVIAVNAQKAVAVVAAAILYAGQFITVSNAGGGGIKLPQVWVNIKNKVGL